MTENYNLKCENDNTDFHVDDFIRRSLINDAVCNPSKKYTRKEIDEYRDNFFSFNSSINQSSHTVDMVDKINDLYLSENNDIAADYNNKPIKDLFNGLTQ